MEALLPLLFYLSLFSFFSKISTAGDIISLTSSIRDGETLISADGSFELGFFTPGSSKNRYLGIWYKKISTGTVVWVANRETPLTDSSGVLKILAGGILVLVNGTESVVWSSNSSTTVQNPVAKLLESGNLVVKDANSDDEPQNFLWQGFDYPCDTLLPGMKDGTDLRTGLNRYLSSWKSANDPSHGNYSFRIDPRGFPQLVLWKGSTVQFRAGSWNGLRFTGTPELKSNPVFTFNFISNQDEVYYTYTLKDPSVVSRFVVNQSGLVQRLTWINRTSDWVIFLTAQTDNCDIYSLCGSYGSCNIHNSPVCECLKGFVPRTPENWNVMDFSDGCVRRTTLNCRNGDGFERYEGVKLPDTSEAWVNMSMSLKECEKVCLKNCSCTAYANSDIRGDGSGCLLWFGNLVDIREFGENGQDLYIRMANSELAPSGDSSKDKRVTLIITGVSLTVAMLLVGFFCYISKRKKPMRRTKTGGYKVDNWKSYKDESPEDLELPLFDLVTIAEVTSNFCSENKLGEGGYGPVYKGKLVVGQEIAVKRLSKNSGQGINEFKNEVKLIAKLQHRNLVKLLGCCIEGEEKMLIYEYMPNKSLDIFIFDETRSTMLHWAQRYNIIDGIARGLLYLHQDSRLRIIHRDLKASNILLDDEMNPKISDFGMARTFRGDQTEENTRRVVGTYGYMSPEYATDGLFSVKSDVFSFGVLVLEIVSGKKNRGFYHPDHHHNLLGHAWRLWKEEKPLEFIDASLGDSTTLSQVFKCIHVGLLCVQQHPEDRPNMSSVLLMLGSATASLPQPKQPGFFTERVLIEQDSLSANEITVTLLEAR